MSLRAKVSTIDPKRIVKSFDISVQITYLNVEQGIIQGRASSASNSSQIYDVALLLNYGQVSCTCPDFENQGRPCKHIASLNNIALRMMQGIKPSQLSL